jgi:hypothetical protein
MTISSLGSHFMPLVCHILQKCDNAAVSWRKMDDDICTQETL